MADFLLMLLHHREPTLKEIFFKSCHRCLSQIKTFYSQGWRSKTVHLPSFSDSIWSSGRGRFQQHVGGGVWNLWFPLQLQSRLCQQYLLRVWCLRRSGNDSVGQTILFHYLGKKFLNFSSIFMNLNYHSCLIPIFSYYRYWMPRLFFLTFCNIIVQFTRFHHQLKNIVKTIFKHFYYQPNFPLLGLKLTTGI